MWSWASETNPIGQLIRVILYIRVFYFWWNEGRNKRVRWHVNHSLREERIGSTMIYLNRCMIHKGDLLFVHTLDILTGNLLLKFLHSGVRYKIDVQLRWQRFSTFLYQRTEGQSSSRYSLLVYCSPLLVPIRKPRCFFFSATSRLVQKS